MLSTITRIEVQKKNKNRFSLYSGDTFLIGISGETLIHFNLHTGDSISGQTLEEIKVRENTLALKEQALRFLARRAHSIRELREKLLKKGYDLKSITRILEELQHKNYLNDLEFAELLLKEEVQLRKSGPLLLKQKLNGKGIDPSVTDDLLRKIYSEELQIRNCRSLGQKKLATLSRKTPVKQKQQLVSYLKSKGYNWDLIQKVISELIREVPDEFE